MFPRAAGCGETSAQRPEAAGCAANLTGAVSGTGAGDKKRITFQRCHNFQASPLKAGDRLGDSPCWHCMALPTLPCSWDTRGAPPASPRCCGQELCSGGSPQHPAGKNPFSRRPHTLATAQGWTHGSRREHVPDSAATTLTPAAACAGCGCPCKGTRRRGAPVTARRAVTGRPGHQPRRNTEGLVVPGFLISVSKPWLAAAGLISSQMSAASPRERAAACWPPALAFRRRGSNEDISDALY